MWLPLLDQPARWIELAVGQVKGIAASLVISHS